VTEFRKVRPDKNEDTAQTMSADDWRLERLINPEPNPLNRAFPSAAIKMLAPDSGGTIAHSWRRTLVFADRWIVDASNRLGAARRGRAAIAIAPASNT
jgi:hypothetical protein